MGGQLFDAEGRLNGFLMKPEDLVISTEKSAVLYDERTALPLNEALVRNVMAYGVREPVIVRKDAVGKPEVVDGRQRVRAAIEANKRIQKDGGVPILVPVLVAKGEDADLFGIMVSLNENRIADPPLVRAKKINRFVALGRTEEAAAVAFGLSTSAVKQHLVVLDAPACVRKSVEAGKLSISAACKLAKLPPEDAEKQLRELEEDSGAERVTVKKAQEKVTGKKRPGTKVLRSVLEKLEDQECNGPSLDAMESMAKEMLVWFLEGEESDAIKALLAE